jgi:hypothetical protein
VAAKVGPVNLALVLLKIYVPRPLKKRLLRELYEATARAFGATPPDLRGLSYVALLESYATFTKSQTERFLGNGERAAAVEGNLYRNAYALGLRLRGRLGLRSLPQVLAGSKILYRTLRIDFEGTPAGDVTIRSCYFSRFYTPAICRVVSSIDAGVAAGLSGGGRLEFSQRMTDGRDCCLARFTFEVPGQ